MTTEGMVLCVLFAVVVLMCGYAARKSRQITMEEIDAMDEAGHEPDYLDKERSARNRAIDRNEQARIDRMRGDE